MANVNEENLFRLEAAEKHCCYKRTKTNEDTEESSKKEEMDDRQSTEEYGEMYEWIKTLKGRGENVL